MVIAIDCVLLELARIGPSNGLEHANHITYDIAPQCTTHAKDARDKKIKSQ